MLSSLVLKARDEMSDYWHKHENRVLWGKHPTCTFASNEQFQAFCVAKDWLQDTCEAILAHRARGFCVDPLQGYIEFLGVMQASFVQQDAINELHYALIGTRISKLDLAKMPAQQELRELRNLTAGHPTNKSVGESRTKRISIRRQAMSYECIAYVERSSKVSSHKTMNLGQLLDNYDKEAATMMQSLFEQLKRQLAKNS